MLPQGSVKTDWEVEIGVVIAQRARQVSGAAHRCRNGSAKAMIFSVATPRRPDRVHPGSTHQRDQQEGERGRNACQRQATAR